MKSVPAKKLAQRKPSKKRSEPFSLYIYRVLKRVHPELAISKRSMGIMNSFVSDIFEKLCLESSKLVRKAKKRTLSCRELHSSIKLVLVGELAGHAISKATVAITKFNVDRFRIQYTAES